MKRILIAMLMLGTAGSASADAATDKISECMRANIPQSLLIKELQLNAYDRTGAERIMRGKLFAIRENGLVRAMLRIEAPSDLRGASYLVRESRDTSKDEMYVYLPALNRARRITGGSQDNPLFGTDISYSDVKQLNSAFTGGEVKLEKSDIVEKRPVHVMALKPDPAQMSRFELIRTWVDQKTCVALKAEFFEVGTLRKRYTAPAASLKQSGPHWFATEGTMEDLGQKTRTRLTVTGISSGTDLADRYFNARTFHIGS